MRIIAVANRKGGVGKSTTVANLAGALASLGIRALAIDLDTQKASLSTWLGRGGDDVPDGAIELADALLDAAATANAIYPSTIKGVDILPCGPRALSALDQVEKRPAPDYMMERVLGNVPNRYDFALIDCPPALSRVVISAIVAADEIIVPMRAHSMSLDAVSEMLQILDEIAEAGIRRKPIAPIVRPLITEPDNTIHGKAAIANVRDNLEHVFTTPIRRNIKLAEAYGFRQSIFEYAPRSNGAADYRSVAHELLGVNS